MPGPSRLLRPRVVAACTRWLPAGGVALALAVCMSGDGTGSPRISPATVSTSAESVLELRRGDRAIPSGGHDAAAATKPGGPREQDFSYTLTNRGPRTVRLRPLAVERAINCRVTSTIAPAVATLAPGAALNLTVRITPRDRGPWRASLSLASRTDAGTAPPAFAWTIAAPGP